MDGAVPTPGAEVDYLQQEYAEGIRSMLDGIGGKDRVQGGHGCAWEVW